MTLPVAVAVALGTGHTLTRALTLALTLTRALTRALALTLTLTLTRALVLALTLTRALALTLTLALIRCRSCDWEWDRVGVAGPAPQQDARS